MKRTATNLLRLAAIAMSAIVLAICVFALPALWRAASKEYTDMAYMIHWIIVAMYAAVIPFYIAVVQAWRLLGYVDRSKPFSAQTTRALRNIMVSAFAITGIFTVSLPFFYIWAQNDDAPGLVVIGMFVTAVPFVVGVFAAVLQQLFREAAKIKSENDLTV